MFFAARTFAMKLGQSVAMLVFTSLAILGSKVSREELMNSNEISATTTGLMIVAFVAAAFCILGAVILLFYREKKVMNTIAKKEDKEFLAAIEDENEIEAETTIEPQNEEVTNSLPSEEELKENKE